MIFRFATLDDAGPLAGWNHQLIQDEGHRNPMTIQELQQRMANWLSTKYRAVIFNHEDGFAAYALYREESDEIYLRQLFVARNLRRHGIGRKAMDILRSQIWTEGKRLTVEVLVSNESAVAFWRSVGYADYSLKLEIAPLTGR